MENRIKQLEARVEQLEAFISQLQAERERERKRVIPNEFVGMTIKHYFCDGYFGRDGYVGDGVIVSNTSTSVTVVKDGMHYTAHMAEEDMRDLIEEWTTKSGHDWDEEDD